MVEANSNPQAAAAKTAATQQPPKTLPDWHGGDESDYDDEDDQGIVFGDENSASTPKPKSQPLATQQ